MTSQLIPWFLVAGLVELIIGMTLGVLIASALVKGHYSYILTHQTQNRSYTLSQPKLVGHRPPSEDYY